MLEKFYRISKAAGVSIHIAADGTLEISACSIEANGNQLDFEKKVIEMKSLQELKKHLPEKTMIALNLSGKGILTKQVERMEEITSHNFSIFLPNASYEDFYVQNFVSGGFSFVSVIRKAEGDKWVNQLRHMGYEPLMLSLGPFAAEQILPQLNVYGGELIFNGHQVERSEKKEWTSYKYQAGSVSSFALKADNEPISEKLLLAYASAFQLLLSGRLHPIQTNNDELEASLANKLGKQKLKVQAGVLLGVVFALLLVNFVVFSLLNSSNAKLLEQVSRTSQSQGDLQSLSADIKKKEALLDSLGWDGGLNKASMIDQMASLLPEEVSWKEVSINPVSARLGESSRGVRFESRRIRITGTSEKIIPVNEWMARVKTRSWVKAVRLESYSYNHELATGLFTMTIDY